MSKKTEPIRVNTIDGRFDEGIAIERIAFGGSQEKILNTSEETHEPHREDRHSFFLLERGIVTVEIDFRKFKIRSSSVVYMHPDQVHRILKLEKVTVSVLAINNENLHPEYLHLLESLKPAKPLVLDQERFSIISETVSICLRISERKKDKLYHSLLKDSCNALVALVISAFPDPGNQSDAIARFKIIANHFKSNVERHFRRIKSPAAYAEELNISTAYLNECVKKATGHPVSYHIQQRIVLEAKRLLYHSDRSVKEISVDLGYDDYPYFSRLFTKIAGVTPLTFRKKNHE